MEHAWELISYTLKSKPYSDKILGIAHKAKTFDFLFGLNSMVKKKMPELPSVNGKSGKCHVIKVSITLPCLSEIYRRRLVVIP